MIGIIGSLLKIPPWPSLKVNIHNYQTEKELFPEGLRILTFQEGHKGIFILQ
jgi:hypothetical protein